MGLIIFIIVLVIVCNVDSGNNNYKRGQAKKRGQDFYIDSSGKTRDVNTNNIKLLKAGKKK